MQSLGVVLATLPYARVLPWKLYTEDPGCEVVTPSSTCRVSKVYRHGISSRGDSQASATVGWSRRENAGGPSAASGDVR